MVIVPKGTRRCVAWCVSPTDPPMRLIDLHCNWLWQYAPETTLLDPSLYGEIPDRLPQLDGYLTGTAATVLACARHNADWQRQPDPWQSLNDLLARYEAEFAGRLLIGPADVTRWHAEPSDGLCWGTLGVAGFDTLVREPADLDRLPVLFERGIRIFQLTESATSRLAGSAEPGDDRGLEPLGRSFLAALAKLSGPEPGPRPIIDLAHLNPLAMAEVLDWIETDATGANRVLPVYSHGAMAHPGFDPPLAISHENLARLRSLGGVVGLTPSPPYYRTPEEFRGAIEAIAAVPFQGRPGYEGIAIGTDFLAVDELMPGVKNVTGLCAWLSKAFDRDTVPALLLTNGRRLLTLSAGGSDRNGVA
jgi:membrane dipeptidase